MQLYCSSAGNRAPGTGQTGQEQFRHGCSFGQKKAKREDSGAFFPIFVRGEGHFAAHKLYSTDLRRHEIMLRTVSVFLFILALHGGLFGQSIFPIHRTVTTDTLRRSFQPSPFLIPSGGDRLSLLTSEFDLSETTAQRSCSGFFDHRAKNSCMNTALSVGFSDGGRVIHTIPVDKANESDPNAQRKQIEMALYEYRTLHVAIPSIVFGSILTGHDYQVRSMRNDYLPRFRHEYDDWLQYSPAFLMLGMKAFGVEGRSSWGRMLTADAFSAAMMGIAVNGLKYTVQRRRPDGSNNKSFPSGHTAMAFMCATMLHKEYGTTRSPWYSVGGYALATTTAVSRMLNNKHWLSDVLVGAGIGILTTELGYYITDRIFKDRGLIRQSHEHLPLDTDRKPSFVGVKLGYSLMPYGRERYVNLADAGFNIGIEGAWFFSRRLGVGAEFDIKRTPLLVERSYLDKPAYPHRGIEAYPINDILTQIGIYYSYPFYERCFFSCRLMGGVKFTQRSTSTVTHSGASDFPDYKIDFHQLTAIAPCTTVGASLMYVFNHNLGIRLFADYGYLFHTTDIETNTAGTKESLRQYLFPVTLGISIDALLW